MARFALGETGGSTPDSGASSPLSTHTIANAHSSSVSVPISEVNENRRLMERTDESIGQRGFVFLLIRSKRRILLSTIICWPAKGVFRI